jgi:hypothetical protein
MRAGQHEREPFIMLARELIDIDQPQPFLELVLGITDDETGGLFGFRFD